MSELLETALSLALRGLRVFPCKPRETEPAIARGFHRATTDETVIREWWSQCDFNIGLATGRPSGVFVLDIDGANGEVELTKLQAQHSALPPTVQSATGKGRHLFFEWPGQPVSCTVGAIAPGIDTRGDGGYVLAPPSIHPSGRCYAWAPRQSRHLRATADMAAECDRRSRGKVEWTDAADVVGRVARHDRVWRR